MDWCEVSAGISRRGRSPIPVPPVPTASAAHTTNAVPDERCDVTLTMATPAPHPPSNTAELHPPATADPQHPATPWTTTRPTLGVVRTWIRDRHRILGPVLICCGLLLVPWLLYLSIELPNTARARNWSLMWTGVDVAEAVGLILTGILQWRRTPRRALPAAFTSALLAIDAWVDVTTSAPGHAKLMSVIMAAGVEVPAAIACLVLAVSTFPVAGRVTTDPRITTDPRGRVAPDRSRDSAGRTPEDSPRRLRVPGS